MGQKKQKRTSWVPTRALNEHFGAISLIFGFLSYIILFTATQPTLKPSYVVHLAVRSIQRGYSYSILMYRGIMVLLGPVSSMTKWKYQVFSRFFGFHSYFIAISVDFFPSTWKSGEEETYTTFLSLENPILGSKMPKISSWGHKGPE